MRNNKGVIKKLLVILLGIACIRYVGWTALLLICIVGVIAAILRKVHIALCALMALCFTVPINPLIIGRLGSVGGICLRIGPLLIGLLLALNGMGRPGRLRLPLGALLIYLFSVSISSMQGWAPSISYMKLINFLIFMLGIWFGTQNLQQDYKGLQYVREFLLAMVVFLIFGSLILLPFPGISTLNGMELARIVGDVELANHLYRNGEGGMTLFCGVVNQSQALAPIVACVFAWVTCDLLFVTRRFDLLRVAVAIACVPLLFLTRSRAGLVAFLAAAGSIYFYSLYRIEFPIKVKQKINRVTAGGLVLLVVIGGALEFKDHAVLRWIRKTDDLAGDTRSLTEAVTSSRQGLTDLNIMDFERNPLLGSGFQVNFESYELYGKRGGLILSAPIEKGLLPLMILGEGGVVGAICFSVFLVSFFVECKRRRLVMTEIGFLVFFATNIGEATFFSPGGIGSGLWMYSVVGCFILDVLVEAEKRRGALLEYRYLLAGGIQ